MGVVAAPGVSLATAHRIEWTGRALGGLASIQIYHHDPNVGQEILTACVSEIIRLEKIFSLFRRDSSLVMLNRDGHLSNPPIELLSLLKKASRVSEASKGAFDITVQPLWTLYAGHFSRSNADPAGPSAVAIEKANKRVGWRNLKISESSITLNKPGMAVTLNGIAQGFITDRVSDLLRRKDIADMLVNLGEFRALGGHPDGNPWKIGIHDPFGKSELSGTLDLTNEAVASSGGYGTKLDEVGHFHHLFRPRDGLPSNFWTGVTVVAKDATTADALSTALSVCQPEQAAEIFRKVGGRRARLISHDGTITLLEG